MKKLIIFLLLLILFPFVGYAQIWEGNGGQGIDEGIGFGDGEGGIDWSDFDGETCTVTFRDIDNTYSQSAVVPVGIPSGYIIDSLTLPDVTGYDFLGWSTLANYPSLVTMPLTYTATETYYTVYTPKKYSVTYMLDNNVYYVAQNVPYGTSTIPLPPDPTYPDIPQDDALYYWQGLPSTMPAEDITVTAVYGIAYWGIDINQSTGEVTYLYRAENMQPISINSTDRTMLNWNDNQNSWKSFVCKFAKPCMLKTNGTVDYYLDIDDQRYKANGEISSDYDNLNYDGNAMVEFKKMYIKVTEPSENMIRVLFAEKQMDNDFHAYAFTRENGTEADYVYIGMYPSGRDSGGKIRSINKASGLYTAHTNLESMAQLNGTGWDVEHFSLRNYINLLTVLVMKNLNLTVANNGGFNNGATGGTNVTSMDFTSLTSKPAFYSGGGSSVQIKMWWINFYFMGDHLVKGLAYDYPNHQWLYRNTPPYSFSIYNNYSTCPTDNLVFDSTNSYVFTILDKVTVRDNLLIPYSGYKTVSADQSNMNIKAFGNNILAPYGGNSVTFANYIFYGTHYMSISTMNGYNNIWAMSIMNYNGTVPAGWTNNNLFICSLVYMP